MGSRTASHALSSVTRAFRALILLAAIVAIVG